MDQADYDTLQRQCTETLSARGHRDPSDLRELLILTTNTTTESTVAAYFRNYHNDPALLKQLIEIALEGKDAGDAPWAAANTLAEFPYGMLAKHKSELLTLSQFEWSYLNISALAALAKIENKVT